MTRICKPLMPFAFLHSVQYSRGQGIGHTSPSAPSLSSRPKMKPILKFPRIIIISVLLALVGIHWTKAEAEADTADHDVQAHISDDSLASHGSTETDYEDINDSHSALGESHEGLDFDEGFGHRSGRAMYLAQGVEFVFPVGVQYTLANINEQLWPIGSDGFEGVLEFPKNKIAIMFSSMINTLKIANFTVKSNVYTPDKKDTTTALRILGTDIHSADYRAGYKETWTAINKDVSSATGGSIPEFVPRGGLYGRTIYPFTSATFVNSIHYQNNWAFPWKDSRADKFTDSASVPYMEVEGLMPYYENDAFVAVAALFKSGTGSVVFLKPKGSITILQLMLNPTALTQIFDENFPGWGVKRMRVRVPQATFTTNSQHFDMLVKRGVTKTFCMHETTDGSDPSRFTLNPIVQTNHLRIAKDTFSIASVTGVTLNNEKELKTWNARQVERDDMAPETLLEEYTTPADVEEEEESSTQLPISDDVVLDDEGTTTPGAEESRREKRSSEDISVAANSSEVTDESKQAEDHTFTSLSDELQDKVEPDVNAKTIKKEPDVDFYDFNEPFLWFLHAINEEPMFMGVIESFKRYLEETGNKENVIASNPTTIASGVIEKNRWIYEAAKGVLWHCPSTINKQAEK